ncbi:Hydroxymethylglutaryl-CoA synthase 1 (HMG-CoA synthase 1) (3-hydroxy-3-methylglutaryl coenzyme A synthase 1) [Durusdinium trenchii]|uniref:Hydroxymethylglutaryl-CoA synthase 1 (HMG-CoA synthase 1) (3-hydroxy-3-methylglutaryl coenzyme A synthase 1) n=1 Tax=Durusdinium trenchii TaxID=1381693 RepID=A0ABP0QLE9_9DINO
MPEEASRRRTLDERSLVLSEGNPQAGSRGQETWDMVGQTELVPQQQVGRRSRNAGIHTIEIYWPQFYFTQVDMEEFDAKPDRYGPTVIGKYTKGIGQVEARFPTDDEDPISFSMTVVHRLLERMEQKGINETGNYMPNGQPLSVWNAIGRIDIGTESIQDRSKSMKSYVMDIFERYANESNIEGVDQYNACYGGQACGLCTLSWVESDRWDGRYGIAVATDISEAHPGFMAFVGAATTATLFFPDAPMSHHSQRASCVLHRFDFCKPVGWHDMAPITDGKYSVECYLDALDACHSTLRQKLNGRGPLEVTDLNVFHTGGGYHIVKKAFERLVRAEQKGIKPDEKERLVQEKLAPSVSLLKIIGPCHTVSSFLNTSSVIMNKMEQALGKIILVFTYGSGCAASMYQMRVDDVPFFDPLEIWKLQFYRNAIKVRTSKVRRAREP